MLFNKIVLSLTRLLSRFFLHLHRINLLAYSMIGLGGHTHTHTHTFTPINSYLHFSIFSKPKIDENYQLCNLEIGNRLAQCRIAVHFCHLTKSIDCVLAFNCTKHRSKLFTFFNLNYLWHLVPFGSCTRFVCLLTFFVFSWFCLVV